VRQIAVPMTVNTFALVSMHDANAATSSHILLQSWLMMCVL
jgi:hypothetical protein